MKHFLFFSCFAFFLNPLCTATTIKILDPKKGLAEVVYNYTYDPSNSSNASHPGSWILGEDDGFMYKSIEVIEVKEANLGLSIKHTLIDAKNASSEFSDSGKAILLEFPAVPDGFICAITVRLKVQLVHSTDGDTQVLEFGSQRKPYIILPKNWIVKVINCVTRLAEIEDQVMVLVVEGPEKGRFKLQLVQR